MALPTVLPGPGNVFYRFCAGEETISLELVWLVRVVTYSRYESLSFSADQRSCGHDSRAQLFGLDDPIIIRMWDVSVGHFDRYIGLVTGRNNDILRHSDLSAHLT